MYNETKQGASWPTGDGEMAERVRGHDWSSTPLGQIERWPQSLRTAVDIMLTSSGPVSVLWGAERIQLYNDAYIPIAAERHPAALGKAAAENWSEVYEHLLGPILDRVLAGETVTIDERSVPLRTSHGIVEERFFTGSFQPVRNESGSVAGVFHPLTEVTARVRVDAELREREARLRRVLDGMGEGFGLLAPDFTILEHNQEALRLDGRTREEIIGRSHWEAYPGSEQSEIGRVLKQAMAEREPVTLERRYAWADGRARWLGMRAHPTADGALAVFWRDVTDRKQAEDALRWERDRSAEILESISDAFYAVDADWRFTYVNRRAEDWWGRRREDLLGKVYWEEFPQAIGSEPYKAHLRAAETREVVRLEAVSPILGYWVDISIYPTTDGGLSVYFRDMTQKKRAEETQAILISELQHRTRNLLGVVQSIAQQTIRASDTLEDFKAAFNDRLRALSRVQGLLSRSEDEPVTMDALIRSELDALGAADMPDRVVVRGPKVRLRKATVQTLALALHELATNARKYGALATESGQLRAMWRTYTDETGRRLVLEWQETGLVRPREEPGPTTKHGGYGRALIERALPYALQARTSYDLSEVELRCTVDLPLADSATPKGH